MSATDPFGLPPQAIEKLGRIFHKYPQIDRVLIYGSRAKGSYRSGSDIDLTIEGKTLGLTELFAIENSIDDLLLPWVVDLSLLHQIDNPDLLDHIHRAGTPFYTKSTTIGSQQRGASS